MVGAPGSPHARPHVWPRAARPKPGGSAHSAGMNKGDGHRMWNHRGPSPASDSGAPCAEQGGFGTIEQPCAGSQQTASSCGGSGSEHISCTGCPCKLTLNTFSTLVCCLLIMLNMYKLMKLRERYFNKYTCI